MTEREVNELSRVIGGLQATVAHLTQMWEHNDREATEGRRALYDKIDKLTAALNKVEARVESLTSKLATLEPSVASLTGTHRENIGSKKMLAFVWTVILAGVSAVSWSAVEVVKLILGKH